MNRGVYSQIVEIPFKFQSILHVIYDPSFQSQLNDYIAYKYILDVKLQR